MKKVLFLIVMWAVCGGWASAQTALEVVWEKNVWPKSIGAAFFSADGQYLYCVEGGTIVKRSATNGDSLTTFERGFVTGIYNNLGRISTKGNYISTISAVWDVKNEKALKEIKIPNQSTNQGLGLSVFYPDENTILFCVVTDHENSPTTVDMVKFDWVNDTIINKCAINGNLAQYEISHDGKTFVTGTTYTDYSDKEHNKLTLWDAETFKEIKVLEDVQTSSTEYSNISFADDDSKILVVKLGTSEVNIYELKTYSRLFVSSSFMPRCDAGVILPDNSHYLFAYGDYSGNYTLELHDSTSKLEEYNLLTTAISTMKQAENIRILCYTSRKLNLLKPKNTSISEDNPSFTISVNTKLLTIDLSKYNKSVQNLTITDLSGNSVYNLSNETGLISDDIVFINNSFSQGTYICTVTNNRGQSYFQKFQVVR